MEMFEGSHARSAEAKCKKHGSGKTHGWVMGLNGNYFQTTIKQKTNPNSCFFNGGKSSRLDIDKIHAKIDADYAEAKQQLEIPSKKLFSGRNARVRKFRSLLGR